MPMLLFGYASYLLLFGQITGNGTINVYGWMFTGLCIAATRSSLATGRESRHAAAPMPAIGRAFGRGASTVNSRRQIARRPAPIDH